jgi:nucleoside-diphosphate-sugar epimerase
MSRSADASRCDDLVEVGQINGATDWFPALKDVNCVMHCAARAHVMNETEVDALAAYRAVNVEGTRRLAEQAATAGIKRFVFLSSIKVNCKSTEGVNKPFTAASPRSSFDGGSLQTVGVHVPLAYRRRSSKQLALVSPSVSRGADECARDDGAPEGAYGVSKWEAEQTLWEISAKTGLEVVVVRSPLVYGPGVKGNLARLLKLVRLGLPLPLGALQNKRSLIGLDNLVDLLIRCVDHPEAAGQTFLVSDGEDLSTPDLIRHMAAAMGRSARLFPVPVSLLRLAGSALGKRAEIDRLVGSLQIDSSHTHRVLGWTPSVSVQEGIRRMVQGA